MCPSAFQGFPIFFTAQARVLRVTYRTFAPPTLMLALGSSHTGLPGIPQTSWACSLFQAFLPVVPSWTVLPRCIAGSPGSFKSWLKSHFLSLPWPAFLVFQTIPIIEFHIQLFCFIVFLHHLCFLLFLKSSFFPCLLYWNENSRKAKSFWGKLFVYENLWYLLIVGARCFSMNNWMNKWLNEYN